MTTPEQNNQPVTTEPVNPEVTQTNQLPVVNENTQAKAFLDDEPEHANTQEKTEQSNTQFLADEPELAPANNQFVDNWKIDKPVAQNETTEDIAYLPSGTNATIRANMSAAQQRERPATPALVDWISTIEASQVMTSSEDVMAPALSRDEAAWSNQITSEAGILENGARYLKVDKTRNYTGSAAELRMRQAAGLGVPWLTALWHTGIWVTFRTPSDGDLVELERRLAQEKAGIGHATFGLAYSNTTIYTQRALMDFILQHIHLHSVKLPENSPGLASIIRQQDYPLLVQGLARAVYSSGFQYKRACIADADHCNHVIRERVDIGKLVAIDRSSLTMRQLQHMAEQQSGSMSLDSIENYQKEFLRGRTRKVVLNDNFIVYLEMPTIAEQMAYGLRWISGIEEQYGQSLTMDQTERDNYLYAQGAASQVRQYGHFIKKIEAQGATYTTQEDLEKAANIITEGEELRSKFMDAAKLFAADSTMSLPAVPNYKCPSCGKFQLKVGQENKRFPDLIAIDAVNTFFTLLVQKATRIRIR